MEQKRLFFIDAIRAWAIVMMLQGHFIDGLLDPIYKDPNQTIYSIWKYFRGITAPVFFTASGLIFTFLLFKNKAVAYRKKRLKKGLKRGVQLLCIGYALRLNIVGLFKGYIYPSFYYVDVLHCIGIAIITIALLYLALGRFSVWFFCGAALVFSSIIFSFEPFYNALDYTGWPMFFSHYFTRENGSVFTVIPWLGYGLFGASLAVFIQKYKDLKLFYPIAIGASVLLGYWLKYESSGFFIFLNNTFGWAVFKAVAYNNYLFIRLGDVLILLAIFMGASAYLKHPKILAIGQNTLSIYVIHSIILYGSFHGFGLYKFYKKSLDPLTAISGALAFIAVCILLSFAFQNRKIWLTSFISRIFSKKKHE